MMVAAFASRHGWQPITGAQELNGRQVAVDSGRLANFAIFAIFTDSVGFAGFAGTKARGARSGGSKAGGGIPGLHSAAKMRPPTCVGLVCVEMAWKAMFACSKSLNLLLRQGDLRASVVPVRFY